MLKGGKVMDKYSIISNNKRNKLVFYIKNWKKKPCRYKERKGNGVINLHTTKKKLKRKTTKNAIIKDVNMILSQSKNQ